jgi:hypothetical protein
MGKPACARDINHLVISHYFELGRSDFVTRSTCIFVTAHCVVRPFRVKFTPGYQHDRACLISRR